MLKPHCTDRSLHHSSELQGSVLILTHPFNIHTPQDQELMKHINIFAQDFVPQRWKAKPVLSHIYLTFISLILTQSVQPKHC